VDHPFITLFKPLLATATADDAFAYLVKHPVLISPDFNDLLQDWANQLSVLERDKARQLIRLKATTWDEVCQGKHKLSLPNPVLDLANQVIKGSITEHFAMQTVAQSDVFIELMLPAITVVCEVAEELMVRDWRPAVRIMRILLAALDARGKFVSENQQAMMAAAVVTWLAVVVCACADVPDGRLFRDAVARGDALADTDRSDPPFTILHRLGALHLDTYTFGRTASDLDRRLYEWQMRLSEELGTEVADVPPEELRMPAIDAALPRAAEYFRRAADRRTGEARGLSLKGFVESLRWQDVRRLPIDLQMGVACAREALALLPPKRFPAEHAILNLIIEHFDHTAASASGAVAAAQALLRTPLEDWLKQKGLLATLDIYLFNAKAVVDDDPQLAFRLWMTVEGLVRSQPEASRKTYDRGLINLLIRAMRSAVSAANAAQLEPTLQGVLQSARREAWPVVRLARSLAALAALTTQMDAEDRGLTILSDYARVFDAAADDAVLGHCLPVLRAGLRIGTAVNACNAGQYNAAAGLYAEALPDQLKTGRPQAALDLIRRILDLAASGLSDSASTVEILIDCLCANAVALEREGGNAATDLIQNACQFAMRVLMVSGRPETTALLFVFDVAKGRRFRAALADRGNVRAWLDAPRTREREAELLRLRDTVGQDTRQVASAIDEDMLLTSYVGGTESAGGETDSERLRNLQITFDRALDRNVIADGSDRWFPTIETLQSTLGPETVLVIQFVAVNINHALSITTLLICNDDLAGAQSVIPELSSDTIVITSGEASVRASIFALLVGDVRRFIVSPPGVRVVDSRALDALERDLPVYLGGPLADALARFRAAGRDHLCFVPHGPLHFFPFHLLGSEDHPVADDWCVTYLPHPSLLDRPKASASGRKALSSIGVNFAASNEFFLGELTESESEAQVIAAAYAPYGTFIDTAAATKAAVLDALACSRRVHISTHGRHNVSGPSFQCLYLQSGPDRIIHAYEFLRLDLSGLDLVTLSACETALGRIDVADNLRGIPAALLIAGVSTIVGTLWNVETDTAKTFFTSFYGALKQTEDKRAAFQAAQRETRRQFPQYRDWGAFQLIGAWS
jgi:CHAT domain